MGLVLKMAQVVGVMEEIRLKETQQVAIV